MKKNKQDQQIFNVPDWTLFSSLETIHQTVGVENALLAKLVAKELTDNALDSGGKCTVGLLENNGFYVEDDGNGIPGTDEEIAALFSIIRDLRSSKLLRLPTRGALGNGLRFVTGLVLSTEGTLTVSTRGRKLQLSPQRHNGETQYERLDDYQKDGTRIEVTLPGLNLSNVFEWADKAISLSGRGKGYKGQTSPFWYSLDSFLKLVHALSSEKTKKITIEFIRNFDGCSGRAKAKEIYNSITRKLIKEFTKSDAQKLLEMMRESTEPIAAKKLGFIGELEGFEGYHRICDESASKEKMAASIPYVIEAWASAAGDEKESCTLFVNRTPLANSFGYIDSEAFNFLGNGIFFNVVKKPKSPIKLLINILTPYIPIMSGAKEPNLASMEKSIKTAVEKAFKELQKKNKPSTKKTSYKSQKKVVIQNIQESIDKASDNGNFRYSIRQLFYVVRPIVKNVTGKDLKYNTFCKIITYHEREQKYDLPNIYRDSRGTLYHPHLKETIQLGTLSVEKYNKPEWAFNKILYCEKEGFLEILISAQWPERHDCVLLTSKGFASRAARDILDNISESNEDIIFFCIHDADTEGTLIYQSLTEATAARPSRKVKVINLGLEPKDVKEHKLEVEKVKKKRKAADYVTSEDDRDWFRNNRVELNAMDTRTFIKWLDDKMDEYARGKLIPPDNVINDELHTIGEAELRNRIRKIIMKEANIDERVEESYTNNLPFATKKFTERTNDLKDIIREDLKKEPTHLWKKPVESLVDKILSDMQFS